jgi:hypothetical protein
VEVIERFIESMGALCQNNATAGHRSECNLLDVLRTFEQMGPKPTEWKQLRDFAIKWAVPFGRDVPSFPLQQVQQREYAKVSDPASDVRPAHLYSYMPAFPPVHTYKTTKVGLYFLQCKMFIFLQVSAVKRSRDPKLLHNERLKQRRLVQSSLNNLEVLFCYFMCLKCGKCAYYLNSGAKCPTIHINRD